VPESAPPARGNTSERRPLGRPPRISREDIARAANDIGLADVTLKAVADRLGVSIAGLYYHVEGKEELLRLAADYSAHRPDTPVDRGQHWSVWLLEWASFTYHAFVDDPGLIAQYLEGAISAETIADNIDAILGVLVRQGFTTRQAFRAYSATSGCAVGMAIGELHEAGSTRNGRPVVAGYATVLAERGPGELPNVRALVADLAVGGPPEFLDKLTFVLVGIAVEHGEDPAKVRRRLRAAKLPR